MQVRINGKIGTFEDVRELLMNEAIKRDDINHLNWWYSDMVKQFKNGREYAEVNKFGLPTIVIDSFIGTDSEYKIHKALIGLEKLSQRIDSQEYADQEEVVNYLLKEWRRES